MTTSEPRTEVAKVVDSTEEEPVTAEALIEEVSIDGMCGVY
jgi:mycofactocin precursor